MSVSTEKYIVIVSVVCGFMLIEHSASAQTSYLPADLPATHFHLTARPFVTLGIEPSAYLTRLQAICTYLATLEDSNGNIIDPYNNTVNQPFQFAYAVATLAHAGASNAALTAQGILAMDQATNLYATTGGYPGGSYSGSEFWLQPLVDAIELFDHAHGAVTAAQVATWQSRMSANFGYHHPGNWATYLMRGEWLQYGNGLIPKATAISDIENAWTATQTVAPQISYPSDDTQWSLYHDNSSSPDTMAVEVVGRSNLLGLGFSHYSGPTTATIRALANTGTATSLLLQDPSGQAPTSGRTDDHVWVDAGYQTAFDIMAETTVASNPYVAGQYRRASSLTFNNIGRWATPSGFYSVTKNFFPPQQRVGYQTASSIAAYDGNLALLTAESYNIRSAKTDAENPAPVEIGGYALSLNNGFHTAFANAGGMAMELDLQGQTTGTSGNIWSTLGVIRMGRVNWDTRLGPSDGVSVMNSNGSHGIGVSFAPTWNKSGSWTNLGSNPGTYAGTFTTTFVNPVLVKASVLWAPQSGQSGPSFLQKFTVTPDGILSQVSEASGSNQFGMTYPIMYDDGANSYSQLISTTGGIASASKPSGDEEDFIEINSNSTMTAGSNVASAYGTITPVRAVTTDLQHNTFVYPRSASDPSASQVQSSFQLSSSGFSSVLGTVNGTLYVGRTSAGGYGSAISIASNNDVTFSAPCGFLLQLNNGVVTAVETDTAVTAKVQQNQGLSLRPHTPMTF